MFRKPFVSGSITLNRCLFRSSHPTATRGLITYADLHNTDPSGNVSALGRSVTNINNCVFETVAGTQYIVSLAWVPNHRAMEVNVNGSTFIDSRITVSMMRAPFSIILMVFFSLLLLLGQDNHGQTILLLPIPVRQLMI
jgi:hypothetical protein